MNPLFPVVDHPIDNVYETIAVLLFSALVLGYLVKLIRLPTITGNMFAGILLGPVLGIVNTRLPTVEVQLEPITNMALSLIAISIGSHLRFRVLHNAIRRIFVLGIVGTIVLPTIVFVFVWITMSLGNYPGANILYSALFMGLLAIAAAPATVIHVVKEMQARGVFVKTLIAVVVFSNVANILLFEGARHWVFEGGYSPRLFVEFGEGVALGVFVGCILSFVWGRIYTRRHKATLSFTALLIVYGLALQLGLPPVLANLSLGITIGNLPGKARMFDTFEDFEDSIYALFFALMGTHAILTEMGGIGLLAAVFFFARIGGNVITVYLSGKLTRMPRRVHKYLGLALTPQAGITIGLVVSLEAMDRGRGLFAYVPPAVLLAITISEILGPIILRFSLRKSGEEGQSLPRLIDFLQEEYIKVGLRSKDKEGVIAELVHFLFKTHPVLRRKKLSRRRFLQNVLKREASESTGVGKAIAIPHHAIGVGNRIFGVMGILPDGVDWKSIDGEPVHAVILLATPPAHERLHLGVLATIGKLFHQKGVLERGLHLAKTPAEVYEMLVDDEFMTMNDVVEEQMVGNPALSSAA